MRCLMTISATSGNHFPGDLPDDLLGQPLDDARREPVDLVVRQSAFRPRDRRQHLLQLADRRRLREHLDLPTAPAAVLRGGRLGRGRADGLLAHHGNLGRPILRSASGSALRADRDRCPLRDGLRRPREGRISAASGICWVGASSARIRPRDRSGAATRVVGAERDRRDVGLGLREAPRTAPAPASARARAWPRTPPLRASQPAAAGALRLVRGPRAAHPRRPGRPAAARPPSSAYAVLRVGLLEGGDRRLDVGLAVLLLEHVRRRRAPGLSRGWSP